nr:hypothetical protein [Mycoplasma haemofelis]
MASKSLMLSLGGLGAGGVGVGGLLATKPWESKKVTFSDKYKHAILDTAKDDDIWGRKYTSLKATKPKHPKLIRAYTEATKQPPENEQEAKRLLKEGCKAIYESPFEDSEYKNDFKSYCSKTNLDASPNQTWNSESTDSSSKWDASLKALKSHDINTKGSLVEVLVTLKSSIQSKDSFEKANRDSLKGWCDGVKVEIFMGSDSAEFKNQELYCKGS